MAFSGSTGAYLRSGSSLPSTTNAWRVNTMHCFIKSSVATGNGGFKNVMELVGSSQNPHEQNCWQHTGAGFDRARAHRAASGAYSAARMTTNPAINTWHSWGSQYTGTQSKIFLNGVNEATTTAAQSANSAVFIHTLGFVTFAGGLDAGPFPEGEVAELAVWNVALSDAEMVALSKGFRANRIRPQSLLFYAPLVRGQVDKIGGRTFSVLGAAAAYADHPRVFG